MTITRTTVTHPAYGGTLTLHHVATRRELELRDALVDSVTAAGITDENDRHRERKARNA